MTLHALANPIGFTAASFTTLAFLPQLLRVLRLRSARDLSLGMFLVFSAGVALWLVYGLLTHSAPVIAANAVTLLLSLSILLLKLRFDRRPHPLDPALDPIPDSIPDPIPDRILDPLVSDQVPQ